LGRAMATHSTNGGAGLHSRGGRTRLPPTVIDDILDSSRRRELLTCLIADEDPIAVTDLATELAETDAFARPDGSTPARQTVRTELYQDHLPKLTATGVVEFDSVLGTVEFTGPQSLETRLTALARVDPGTKDK